MKIVKTRKPDEIELDSILPQPDKLASDFRGVIALYQPEKRTIYRLHGTPNGGQDILQFTPVVCLGGAIFDCSPTLYRTWSRHYGPGLEAVLEPFLGDACAETVEYFKTEKEFTEYVQNMIKEHAH